MPDPMAQRDVTLLDLVDSILDKGAVLSGDLTLAVADVDLVRVSLRSLLASVETLDRIERDAPTTAESGPARREALPREARELRPPPARRPGETSVPPHSLPRAMARTHRAPVIHRPTPARRDERRRINTDPERVERGLGQLVLTVVELLRQLMERQALRRMESGSLTSEEVERLGLTFSQLERRMEELKRDFGLEDEELNIHLGPLGDLL